jgi:protein involved in polysaccharide export with SLBB domain
MLVAISKAGGLLLHSATRDSYILRTDKDGVQHEIPVRLDEILKRKLQDVMLQPGDVLVVPGGGLRGGLRTDPPHIDPPASTRERPA